MNIHHAVIANALLATLFVQSAYADGNRKGHRGPPQEAIDACASQTEGAACTFTGRNSEQMSGVCFAPQDRDLACKPEGHEGRGGKGKNKDRDSESASS